MSTEELLKMDWFTKNHETREYHLAYSKLVEVARNHGIVTYQELADFMDKTLRGAQLINTAAAVGGAITLNEHLHGRPLLSAILVSVSGKPGEGFFELARKLGKLRSEHPADEQRFWEQEKQAIYDCWKKKFK